MRRSHANGLRRQGVDLSTIQVQLGHSDLSVTTRYLAVSPIEHAASVMKLKFGT